MKRKKGSLIIYGILSLFLTAIALKVMTYSFVQNINSKKDYILEAKSFARSEINHILKDSKDNGISDSTRQLNYDLDFNYNVKINITSETLKNSAGTSSDFNIKYCFPNFPGSTNTFCQTIKGIGDLTNL